MTLSSTASAVASNKKPKILCIDDEPNVLEGLMLNLRRRMDVMTATSGPAGLELLAREPLTTVVLSDMRMPGMDGAAFFARARELRPDATRILLTGQADLNSAVEAVNEGQIFRFLTKPCSPTALIPAVEAGVEQYRLLTAERVLLEETLHGSIKALTEILALASPASFGRAMRIKQHVTEIAVRLHLRDSWQVEVAAMLSPIGLITLPPETAEKFARGQTLTHAEQAMLAKAPEVTERLLAGIPRLETVRAILSNFAVPGPAPSADNAVKPALARACDVLRAAVEFDELEMQGFSDGKALDTLRTRVGRHDDEILNALREARDAQNLTEMKALPVGALRAGMVLVDDLRLRSGVLVITRGFEITDNFLERLLNFGLGAVQDPVKVLVKREFPAE